MLPMPCPVAGKAGMRQVQEWQAGRLSRQRAGMYAQVAQLQPLKCVAAVRVFNGSVQCPRKGRHACACARACGR